MRNRQHVWEEFRTIQIRISRGRFVLNGRIFPLRVNNGPNHLHGGPTGFHRRVWYGKVVDDDSVVFLASAQTVKRGYPGNLMVSVKYTFTNKGRLVISLQGACRPRYCRSIWRNHTYFNLNGHDSGSVNGQYLHIWADKLHRKWQRLLANQESGFSWLGRGKTMDFREVRTIGERIGEDNIHLKMVQLWP